MNWLNLIRILIVLGVCSTNSLRHLAAQMGNEAKNRKQGNRADIDRAKRLYETVWANKAPASEPLTQEERQAHQKAVESEKLTWYTHLFLSALNKDIAEVRGEEFAEIPEQYRQMLIEREITPQEVYRAALECRIIQGACEIKSDRMYEQDNIPYHYRYMTIEELHKQQLELAPVVDEFQTTHSKEEFKIIQRAVNLEAIARKVCPRKIRVLYRANTTNYLQKSLSPTELEEIQKKLHPLLVEHTLVARACSIYAHDHLVPARCRGIPLSDLQHRRDTLEKEINSLSCLLSDKEFQNASTNAEREAQVEDETTSATPLFAMAAEYPTVFYENSAFNLAQRYTQDFSTFPYSGNVS